MIYMFSNFFRTFKSFFFHFHSGSLRRPGHPRTNGNTWTTGISLFACFDRFIFLFNTNIVHRERLYRFCFV